LFLFDSFRCRVLLRRSSWCSNLHWLFSCYRGLLLVYANAFND
jgi:hypothetical protein